MKKLAMIIAGISVSSVVIAQNVNYTILSNEPPQTPQLSINSDLFQLDLMQHTIDSYSINAAIWGHYEPVPEKFGVQLLLRKSYLTFGRLGYKKFPGNSELEAGAYLVLRNTLKNKATKITLKKEYSGTTYSTNVSGDIVGSRTETETYIVIPSDKKKLMLVRGGAYFKRFGMTTDHIDNFTGPEYVSYASGGIYAGITMRTITSIFVDTDKYGVQFNSIGRDLYADLLILPVNTFKDPETGNNASKSIKDATSSIPIGVRAGYRLFQVDKRTKTGKTFGLCANFEAGYKPFAGITLSAGIGMTFVK